MKELHGKITVPDEFCVEPFYKKGSMITFSSIDNTFWKDESYFLHDIVHYLNAHENRATSFPWENPIVVWKHGFELWQQEGVPALEKWFQRRDRKAAKPLMVKYVAIYIQMMYWVQGYPVTDLFSVQRELADWKYSPINISERLSFILTTPNHHHSYTTLNQLFKESNKKLAIFLTNE